MKEKRQKSKNRINSIGVTNDSISGRGGVALFERYLEQTGILSLLLDNFGHYRKSQKSFPIDNIFKQIFCWLFDGTSRAISYFDHLKTDVAYAKLLGNTPEEMASSHQIKRFFRRFTFGISQNFRKILKTLLLWRLNVDRPPVINLFIDVTVLNNNESNKKQGVKPTYKHGVKGFTSLHIVYNGTFVDAIFRSGDKHSNHGNDAFSMIVGIVEFIREKYSRRVPVIFHMD